MLPKMGPKANGSSRKGGTIQMHMDPAASSHLRISERMETIHGNDSK